MVEGGKQRGNRRRVAAKQPIQLKGLCAGVVGGPDAEAAGMEGLKIQWKDSLSWNGPGKETEEELYTTCLITSEANGRDGDGIDRDDREAGAGRHSESRGRGRGRGSVGKIEPRALTPNQNAVSTRRHHLRRRASRPSLI